MAVDGVAALVGMSAFISALAFAGLFEAALLAVGLLAGDLLAGDLLATGLLATGLAAAFSGCVVESFAVAPLLNGAGGETFSVAAGSAFTATGFVVDFASLAAGAVEIAGSVTLALLGTPTSDAICPSYW
jgi:hypothetical protein